MLRQVAARVCKALAAPGVETFHQIRGLKRSTFLTGLAVDPDADRNILNVLNELSRYAQEKLPDGCAYRQGVVKYCDSFLSEISQAGSQEAAEEKFGRQYEEIINDCVKELELVDTMAEWKPWQKPDGHDIRMFADLKDIPGNVKKFREYQAEIASKQE